MLFYLFSETSDDMVAGNEYIRVYTSKIDAFNAMLARFWRKYPEFDGKGIEALQQISDSGVYDPEFFEKISEDEIRIHDKGAHSFRIVVQDVTVDDCLRNFPVSEDDRAEFVGQVIDVFEDFLEGKGINIDNPEKEDDENAAILYGSDYGQIQSELESLMIVWKIMEEE